MKNSSFIKSMLLSAFLVFTCSCSDTSLENYTPGNHDETEIKSLLLKYQDAKNRHDLDQLLACFHERGRFSFQGGPLVTKEHIRKYIPGFWAGLKSGNPEFFPMNHEFFTGDYFLSGWIGTPQIAIEKNTAEVTAMFNSGWWDQRLYISMLRENGRWSIIRLDWKSV